MTTKKTVKKTPAKTTKKSAPKKKPEVKKETSKAVKKAEAKKETIKQTRAKMDPEKKKELFAPNVEKVTINIGVGEAGERLKKAEKVLENITGQKPIETLSKTTNKDWAIRKMMPIGCKVTLRGKKADEFITDALSTRENKMADYSFDDEGNLSFGIPDHTLFKSQKYDPNIGIFGMDVNITMKKHGYRVKNRRIARRRIPHKHRVQREETMKFFSEKFNVEVIS
jgi:large subunit ribosomal protein L5